MKKLTLSFTLILAAVAIGLGQVVSTPPSGNNQRSVVKQYIGSIVYVKVVYNSPDVTSPSGDDRTGHIWGELVPYGLNDLGFGLGNPSPWRAGSNENTTITFSHDVEVQGQPIAAGTYGLHLIVEENGPWTWIFSSDTKAWGSYFYEAENDVLRVEATPKDCDYTEWLTYEFTDRQPTSAELQLAWENKSVPMQIEVPDMKEVYYTTMSEELKGGAGFTYQNWLNASSYLTQADYKLDKALEWADAAISAPFIGERNWTTLQNKSTVLMKLDRREEAQATMMEAIELPSATAFQIHQFGRQLISLGEPDKALEVFQMNHEKFDGAWPTNVGMARGLSAVGKYDEALKYAKLAHDEAPDDLNKNSMAGAIEKLEQKQDIN